jgi:RNA polymerase sigma factor (sigma-70 family)
MSILAIDALGTRYELTSSVIDGLFEANEESLVLAAKSGDSQAFVELSTPHTAKLLTRVNQITRNREDAEDVVQEAILRAFLHLDKFEGRSAFATWLTRIAINSALMRLRRKRAEMISLDLRSKSRCREKASVRARRWQGHPRGVAGHPRARTVAQRGHWSTETNPSRRGGTEALT